MFQEELLSSPREVLERTLARLHLPWEDAVLGSEGNLRAVNSTTPPGADKWRRETPGEVERILPLIAPLQAAFGYPVDMGPTPADQPARTLDALTRA